MMRSILAATVVLALAILAAATIPARTLAAGDDSRLVRASLPEVGELHYGGTVTLTSPGEDVLSIAFGRADGMDDAIPSTTTRLTIVGDAAASDFAAVGSAAAVASAPAAAPAMPDAPSEPGPPILSIVLTVLVVGAVVLVARARSA